MKFPFFVVTIYLLLAFGLPHSALSDQTKGWLVKQHRQAAAKQHTTSNRSQQKTLYSFQAKASGATNAQLAKRGGMGQAWLRARSNTSSNPKPGLRDAQRKAALNRFVSQPRPAIKLWPKRMVGAIGVIKSTGYRQLSDGRELLKQLNKRVKPNSTNARNSTIKSASTKRVKPKKDPLDGRAAIAMSQLKGQIKNAFDKSAQ